MEERTQTTALNTMASFLGRPLGRLRRLGPLGPKELTSWW